MVVFVYGAQLPFEQRDCALRARYWEDVEILLCCTSGSSAGQKCLISALGREMSPPQPGGHTWMLWLMCPGANLFSSVPVLSLCCELGINVPRLTDFYCLRFWLVLLKKIIKSDPHRGLILGMISVVSCCWEHLLEKRFSNWVPGDFALADVPVLLFASHFPVVRGRKYSIWGGWSFSVWWQ